MNRPPAVLDGAEVLEYAIVDDSVHFTGRLHLYHGDNRIGPVPGLAICKKPDMAELLLFHCDNAWNVLGAQIWNSPDLPAITSADQVKEKAENFYKGISEKWIKCE